MALVMLSPGLPWPMWCVGFFMFLFALWVMRVDGHARGRRLVFGVMLAMGMGLGPFVLPMHAVSVGKGICALLPFLLECWLF